MRYWVLLFVVLLQFLSTPSSAQNKQLRFERIGTNQGLSDPIVLSIAQDSKGYVWIGTRTGLNRYDGHEFKKYFHDATDTLSLTGNYIHSIIEDSKGNIWVATSEGLNKFDRKKDQFHQYLTNPNDPNTLSAINVLSIAEDHSGNFWIATNNGFNFFNPEKNLFTRFFNNKNDSTTISGNSLLYNYCDSEGTIWIGTVSEGLNKYIPGENRFVHYKKNSKNSEAISGNRINTIFEDSRHRFWIGTDEGLNLMDRKTGKFRHFKHQQNSNSLSANNIICLDEDSNGNLLIGVENGGINFLDSTLQKFTNYKNDEIDENSLSANSIYSIMTDNRGNIWAGTFSGGINLFLKSTANFNHYRHNSAPESLSNNFVLSILEDHNENLWIGTDGGGLNFYERKTGKYNLYLKNTSSNSIAGNYVTYITEDKNNNLWIGTWGDGASKLDLKTKKFTNFNQEDNGLNSKNIYAITIARDGKVWFGTFGGGVNVYDEKSKKFTYYQYDRNNANSLSDNNIYSILEDHTGRIWIGCSDGGINLFDPVKQNFARYNSYNGKINSNTIYHISEFSDGKIYGSTSGLGISYYDNETDRFIHIDTENKLASEYIYAMLEDDKGNIWASTNEGISKFNPKTREVNNYTIEDGLQADEFKPHSAFKSKTGMMYFGGVNGYNSFFPDQVKDEVYNPPIVLSDLKIFNKSVPIAKDKNDASPLKKDISETESIVLQYNQSVITIDFATLDFASSGNNDYAYMLEGFDEDWNYVTNKNSATYTNLDHGDYVFRVKGKNNKGEWSDKVCSLEITIVPPFWLTWWFKTLMGLVLVIIPVLITYLRIRQLRHQREKLEEMVAERTNEIQNKNEMLKEMNSTKDKLFSIISHDLRSPFSAILGFQDLLVSNYSAYSDKERIEMLRQVQSTTNQVYYLVENLLSWSRIQTNSIKPSPELFNVKEIVLEKIDLYEDIAKAKGIVLESHIADKIQAYADINIMTGVLRNLINNAVKFTPKGGKIDINALQENNHVLISVTDNGTGMSQAQIDALFNIETTKSKQGTNGETGSGLGLILCKEFTEKNNGELIIESQEGEGSTFSFTIPVKPVS